MKFCIGFCLLALMSLPLAGYADEVAPKQHGRWAQDYAGRPADPAVRFGTLPNGLRYAIMHNETPSDGVAMRMLVSAGSLEERDEERGLAHFIEHLAFRGSTNVPDGEVVRMLERQGLAFGPDTNAFTTQDQTVYQFNFPKADSSALDTGLKLFREIGERLALAPAAIESEKGVILSEERLRDTPAFRAQKVLAANQFAGTLIPDRQPIGLIETVKAATPDRLRRFYLANYRPDNVTIVVVGNIDAAAVEQQIKARFADWKPSGAPDLLKSGAPDPKRPAAEYVADGAPALLTLSWVRPVDSRADTDAVERQAALRLLGLIALNNRLSDRALKPGAPYLAAAAQFNRNFYQSLSTTTIGVSVAQEKWRAALDAVTDEQRRLLRDGITPGELQRAVTQLRTALQAASAGSSTRNDTAIADAIVAAANYDIVFSSPAQTLAFYEPILASATPTAVTAALRDAFTGKGPVLFRSAQASPATIPVLEQALTEANTRPLNAAAAETALAWPYGDFGTVGKVVSQSTDRDLGTTEVRFANGTRLLVKPTSFEKDRVRVSVSFGNGASAVPRAQTRAIWALSLFPIGGTQKLSAGDIQRWIQTSGKEVSAALTASATSFRLAGVTRPADLLTEMQLLTAYARDPGFRPEMGDRMKGIEATVTGQIDSNPSAVFVRGLGQITTGNDPRFATLPTAADIAATAPGDIAAILRQPLSGSADIVMVGDVSVADAVKAVQGTFGAGPARNGLGSRPAVRIRMPQGRVEPYIFLHSGRADQALYGEVWPLPDYFMDPKASRVADVVSAILQARLVDSVREKLGITYSPSVKAASSVELSGQGYMIAMIETPEDKFGVFRSVLAEQLADISAKPVSSDELDRAKQPLINAARKERENNDYWIANLPLELANPRVKPAMLDEIPGLSAVSTADIQLFANRFIKGKLPSVVIAKPKKP